MTAISALPVEVLERLPKLLKREVVDGMLKARLSGGTRKIVVLDDDPTGVQTVHGISVYTDWEQQSINAGFAESGSMFFILTNSRGMTVLETTEAHTVIAERVHRASQLYGKDFILISRSDSTLRGHYPLETEVLRQKLEELHGIRFDGEIIAPFFKEGGRYTIGDVHYVREGDKLIPAGHTEFAGDKSFGYSASDLKQWCEEKTGGKYKASDAISITIDELRGMNIDDIKAKLLSASAFNKIILNAAEYSDIKVFALAYLDALEAGKNYIFRSAAAMTKVLGGVEDKQLLSTSELREGGNKSGGFVIAGSHVAKTTRQLKSLLESRLNLEGIEFNQHLVLEEGMLEKEVERVTAAADALIRAGTTAVVYTRRDRLDLDTEDADRQLEISVKISDALTGVAAGIKEKPGFIIAKGGITSSDVGIKALKVKKAMVMGQILYGVPVWMTGQESKFPGMPYVIFPGNVGDDDALKEAVIKLTSAV
ncbi:MAG: four-carbon acid sugar kinase family protein [Christensenellales bacterium]